MILETYLLTASVLGLIIVSELREAHHGSRLVKRASVMVAVAIGLLAILINIFTIVIVHVLLLLHGLSIVKILVGLHDRRPRPILLQQLKLPLLPCREGIVLASGGALAQQNLDIFEAVQASIGLLLVTAF